MLMPAVIGTSSSTRPVTTSVGVGAGQLDASDRAPRRQARRDVRPAPRRQPAPQQPVGVRRVDRDQLHGLVAALRSRAERDRPAGDRTDPTARRPHAASRPCRRRPAARAPTGRCRPSAAAWSRWDCVHVAANPMPKVAHAVASTTRNAAAAPCGRRATPQAASGRVSERDDAARDSALRASSGSGRRTSAAPADQAQHGGDDEHRVDRGAAGHPVGAQLQVGERRQREEQQVGAGAGDDADPVLADAARRSRCAARAARAARRAGP